MIDSKIFIPGNLSIIENNLKKLLNECKDLKNPRIIASPRAVGDTVQEILEEKMPSCFPEGLIQNFEKGFPRRSMQDIAFNDMSGNCYYVDIKTHNKNTDFNMPNLTSVERLSRFYENDKNFFVILLAEYQTTKSDIEFERVRLIPIEHLKWDCLTIGALGWGQIQIANANIVNIDSSQSRKQWMLGLCDALSEFYPKEITKINKRMKYFSGVRDFWDNKLG